MSRLRWAHVKRNMTSRVLALTTSYLAANTCLTTSRLSATTCLAKGVFAAIKCTTKCCLDATRCLTKHLVIHLVTIHLLWAATHALTACLGPHMYSHTCFLAAKTILHTFMMQDLVQFVASDGTLLASEALCCGGVLLVPRRRGRAARSQEDSGIAPEAGSLDFACA